MRGGTAEGDWIGFYYY